MKKINRQVIPSLFTAANILCGYLCIIYAIQKDFDQASWMVLLAMVFDILDGRVARGLKAETRFGFEFDSLGDVVSFGAAPAVLMYQKYFTPLGAWGMIFTFVFLLCGALRLARFNVTPSKSYFEGLPIPGAAGLLATFTLIDLKYNLNFSIQFMVGMMLLFAFLMVSQVRFLSLKKDLRDSTKRQYLGYILIAILLTQYPEEILFVMGFGYTGAGLFTALLGVLPPPLKKALRLTPPPEENREPAATAESEELGGNPT